jgi:hypothetical protein
VTRQTFDLAYARLLLSHLVEPVAALRAMRAAVRPGGVVAVEDLFTGTLDSAPRRRRWSGCRRSTAPPCASMGATRPSVRAPPALLATVGLSDVGEQLVASPMTTVDQKLFLAELVDNMRQAMLEARAASPGELDDLGAAVATAARDPGTVFHQARIHQVYGHRQD